MSGEQSQPRTGRWSLGCQARPWMLAWGEAFPRRLPEVMAQIAAIGFTGFETRLDRLPLDDPDGFAAARAGANGLALCGAHLGGRWWAAGEEARIPAIVAQARRLPALGCQRLVVSMAALPPDDPEALERMTATLNHLGRACHEAADVAIVLHNHAAELTDDARVLAEIVARCPPEHVMLGPDLGWVAYTGMDVSAFLRRFAARIAYLHVRDITAPGEAGEWVEVGQGIMDHAAILRTLAALDYRGWLVAESEFPTAGPVTAAPRDTAVMQYRGVRAALDAAGLTNAVG